MTRITATTRPAIALILLLTWIAAPADALVFASPVAYDEAFEAEVGFPTTPDADLLAAGGVSVAADSDATPTLTGSSVQMTVPPSDFRAAVEVDVDETLISTLAYDVGLRSVYSSLSLSGDGEARLVHALQFTLDQQVVPGGTYVGALLDLRRLDQLRLATLILFEEREDGSPSGHLDTTSVPLPTSTANRIFAGDAFTLDVEVDRAAGVARASFATGEEPEIQTPPLPLAFAQDYSITRVVERLERTGPAPITAGVELDDLQVRAVPRTFEGLFNIDVGTFWGTPAETFAAAGEPGAWNTLTIGPNALVDLAGLATTASAELFAEEVGERPSNGTDPAILLADWAEDAGGWAVAIDGLSADVVHRVIFYAFAKGSTESGALFANGAMHSSLSGVGVPDLVEGQSFARVEAIVAEGRLDLAGVPDVTVPRAQLSGLQIERTVPLPEPALGGALALGVALLVGRGRRVVRRP